MSVKNRKCSMDSKSLLRIPCMTDVAGQGRLKWFGHREHNYVKDGGDGL